MPLTVTISSKQPNRIKTDVLVLPVKTIGQLTTILPIQVQRSIRKALTLRDFKAAWGESILLPESFGTTAKFVAVVGLGKLEPIDRQAEGLRQGIGRIVQDMRGHGLQHLTLTVLEETAPIMAAAGIEGAWLGAYRFTEYSARLRKQQRRRGLRSLTIVTRALNVKPVRRALAEAKVILRGVDLARDLVNRPGGATSPAELVATAQTIARKSDRINLKVFNRVQAKRAGFTAFLAVARGSQVEPYVIHLTYEPPGRTEKTAKVFLIGKGVTFDSGGLSIKPADYMENMKTDMAGAAALLGAFSTLAYLAPDLEVHGVIAACENMPSGTAYRPGDIVTAMNGKTIEVLNTDAEGRLTLADTLSYAVTFKPTAIVDIATLTGSAMIALGETTAGLFGNNEALLHKIKTAASLTGEGLAQLPLPDEYRQQIRSEIADLINTATTRYGGAITAALFLREFVNGVSWAHLDIAGPSFAERPWLPYFTRGATGYGVRMLVHLLRNFSKPDKND